MIRIFGYIWLLIRIQVLLTAVKLFTCRFQVEHNVPRGANRSNSNCIQGALILIFKEKKGCHCRQAESPKHQDDNEQQQRCQL